ncbi:MAG: hypothetical protein ACRC9L_01300 [Brevinema sp.]
MNRRILFLGGAFLSAVLFFSFGIMILQQKGLAQREKQWSYSKKALSVANTLTKRLSVVLNQAGEYTNSVAMGEFFTTQSISLLSFPESFRETVRRIRIADSSGNILFSTSGTLDRDARLSPNVLSLASGAVNKFIVFTPDQDTFVAVTRYDNPTTLQPGSQGFILFEFSSAAMMQGFSGLIPIVRVENGSPLLVLNSAPYTPFKDIVNFNLDQPQKRGPLTGLHLRIPHLENMVFYMGTGFYFPPLLGIFTFIFCLIMVAMLYLYVRYPASSQHSIPEDKVEEMRSLISDINRGKTYSQKQAFNAVENGSRFGNLASNEETTSSFHEDSEKSEFSFGLLDEDPIFDDEPAQWNNTDEDNAFNNIAIPEHLLTEDDDFEDSLREGPIFDNLEDEELPELGLEEENDIADEAGDDPIFDNLEDEELPELGLEEENDIADEAGDDPIFDNLEDEELPELGLEEENDIEASQPIEEGEASINEIASIFNNTEEEPVKDEIQEGSLDLYNKHLDELVTEYEISHRAVAENREGLFLIDDTSVFGSSFQIAVEDPIFKEVLSKGRALSLDGELGESDYIRDLIAPNILENLSDLFIVPITNKEHRVSHVVVLGRDKGSRALTVEEHQNLFSYQ